MTTAPPVRNEYGPPPPSETPYSLDRQAMRFLIGHRLGRLLTLDPATDEPLVTPVHYVLDHDGALVTHLPRGSEHVEAIRRGGTSLLSVHANHAYVPSELRDADGLPTPQAVRQVQAEVTAELVEQEDRVADVLHRQISSVLETIGQESEADAAGRASRSALGQLVVVRMHIEQVRTRLHRAVA